MKVNKILSRFYVNDMDKSVELYENILNVKCSLRFKYNEMDLELAQVGDILLLCGSDESLEPFRDTKATFLVDSIAKYRDYLLNNGAVVIRDLKEVPTGKNMTLKHIDGNIVEYVEFRK